MDITPLIPKGRKIIGGYGDGGFTVGGQRVEGSLLVLPDEVIPWDVAAFEKLTQKSFAALNEHHAIIDVLLIGCGKTTRFLSKKLEDALRRRGVVPEVMDTGAACRTYNILLSEERRVAAALIAV